MLRQLSSWTEQLFLHLGWDLLVKRSAERNIRTQSAKVPSQFTHRRGARVQRSSRGGDERWSVSKSLTALLVATTPLERSYRVALGTSCKRSCNSDSLQCRRCECSRQHGWRTFETESPLGEIVPKGQERNWKCGGEAGFVLVALVQVGCGAPNRKLRVTSVPLRWRRALPKRSGAFHWVLECRVKWSCSSFLEGTKKSGLTLVWRPILKVRMERLKSPSVHRCSEHSSPTFHFIVCVFTVWTRLLP